MTLIYHSTLTYQITADEADIRRALIAEALDRHGLTHDGAPIKGLTSRVTFDGRRGSGSYTIHITRDVSKSGQASLPAPEGAR